MKKEHKERKKRGTREKLRLGWTLVLAAVIAVPLCFLLSLGRIESGQHMEPGYTMEVPGLWERTDYRVIGPAAAADAPVSASMNGEALVYDFGGQGEHARVTLHIHAPEEQYYADDHLEFEYLIEREADTEQTPGDIRCMFWFADGVAEGDEGVTVAVRAPFRRAYSGETDMEPVTYADALTRKERHYVVANASFPEGSGDGENLYIVMEASDDREAGVRTVLAWQYRWKQGPVTVEVPPQPGIIEYYRAYTPLDLALRAAAYVLILLLAALLVRQFILAAALRKEKKAASGSPEDRGGPPAGEA